MGEPNLVEMFCRCFFPFHCVPGKDQMMNPPLYRVVASLLWQIQKTCPLLFHLVLYTSELFPTVPHVSFLRLDNGQHYYGWYPFSKAFREAELGYGQMGISLFVETGSMLL